MKGLLITNDFPPMTGGEARYYARLCATVPAADVLVLTPRVPGAEAFDRAQAFRIERVPVPTGPRVVARLAQMAGLLWYAGRLVRPHGVRRVHVGHLYLGPVALTLRARYGLPYVLYLHGGEMAPYLRHRAVRRIVRGIVRQADLVVVNSSFTRRYFERLGLSHPRTVRLTMAVDVERFTPTTSAVQARAGLGLDGRRVLLTVGRLVERKGHDIVLRAIPDVARAVGPVQYLIAGEGPTEPRLRRLARDLGLTDQVRFLGRVQDADLAALYAACDVFVMPSRTLPGRDGVEGFGIAFLEAAAAGRPAVGGRSGGIPDAIEDGLTGLLVTPDSVREVADALVSLLNDPPRAEAMGRRARERAVALHAQWSRTVREIWDA